VYGPEPRGTFVGHPYSGRHFKAGRKYRVTKAFTDHDGLTHPVGEEWFFLGDAFSPYDDGVSWFVSLDGRQEWHLPMQSRPEQQGPVLDSLNDYVTELSESWTDQDRGEIEYRLRFTDAHLSASILRFRQLTAWRYALTRTQWVLLMPVAVILILSAVTNVGVFALLLCGGLALLLLTWPFEELIQRQRFRTSYPYNQEVVILLMANGVHVAAATSREQWKWATIKKARRFEDGTLLIRGAGAWTWLPDAALSNSSARTAAIDIVRAQVTDYRDVEVAPK